MLTVRVVAGQAKSPAMQSRSGAHHHFRFLPSKAGLIYEALGLVGDQHLCVCLRLGQSVISSLERDGQTVPSPFGGGRTDSGAASWLLRSLLIHATTATS